MDGAELFDRYFDDLQDLMRDHEVDSADDLPADVIRAFEERHPEVVAMQDEDLEFANAAFRLRQPWYKRLRS